jgi:predicted transcriptional regulator
MTRNWTFLTNHAHTLLAIAQNPDARLRDIAAAVGITERAAFRIIGDLEEAGYVTKRRVGRRNVYEVHDELPLRHPLEQQNAVRSLLGLINR